MIELHGDLGVDEERLRAADPDGLYLFALERYPYIDVYKRQDPA